MLHFSSLTLNSWRQFEVIEIDLSSNVTILTGSNGSGKTTILNLLSRHFGWNWLFVSTPWIGKRRAKKIWSDIYLSNESDENYFHDGNIDEQKIKTIGAIKYDTGDYCNLLINYVTGAQYHPTYQGLQPVEGLHIPSHRPAAAYHKIETIPAEPITTAQQYQEYQALLTRAYGAGRAENPGKIQKQSLIALALLGEGNSNVPGDERMNQAFKGFQQVLQKILPFDLGFQRLEIRMPEVILVCKTGSFPMDAMSGGISAIFSIAWQIFMFGQDKNKFTITIDEPENHLHPTLQRRLLPSLAAAFPNCKFIVATHSPFIVTSFPEAKIFSLNAGQYGRIRAVSLSEVDISGTPNETLRTIFDVESNLPVWVERQIKEILEDVSALPNEVKAHEIMRRLANLGLADSIVEYRGK